MPIILGIIKATKKEADQRSVEMYEKAVENAIVQYQMKENKMPSTYDEIKDYIKYDGLEITFDRMDIYEDGSVYIQGIKNKSDDKILANSVGTKQRYIDGEEVYIDITTGKSCTNYHVDNSKTGYNGLATTKTTDNQNSCLKFYAFLDDGSKNLNLLLDHNTTAKLAWHSSDSNASGPKEVFEQLKTDTNEWVGTITPTNYEYKGMASPYTINYSEYKARLITAQEIAKITGADQLLSWNETSTTSGWYYLDGAKTNDTVPNWQTQVANSTNKSDFYWLFDRTNSCKSYGCQVAEGSTNGYWTVSAHASDSNLAWYVHYNGTLYNNYVNFASYYGVRPVITILKSNI